jgi:hypothetical protein
VLALAGEDDGAPSVRAAAGGLRLYRHGGHAVLATPPATAPRVHVVFRCGGFGALTNAGHAHADALSVLVRVDDVLVLGDPGSGSYTGQPRVRETFRSTALHNTVEVDGLSQADPLDAFKWVNVPAVRCAGGGETDGAVWVAAAHDGYARLRRPIRHRRDVALGADGVIVLLDRLIGNGTHAVRRRFIVPPDVRVTITDGAAALAGSDGAGLVLRGGPSAQAVDEPVRVDVVPWSPGYGRWDATAAVTLDSTITAPSVLVTVLCPTRAASGSTSLGAIVRDRAEAGPAWRWTIVRPAGTTSDRLTALADDGLLWQRSGPLGGTEQTLRWGAAA